MKKKKVIAAIIIFIIVVIAATCFWYFQIKKPHDEAVGRFDKAVSALKKSNEPLNEAISSLQSVIDSREEPLDQATLSTAKSKLSEAKKTKLEIPEMPKKTADINDMTKKISNIPDYSSTISGLSEAQTNLENSIKQLKQVTNPSQDFVIERLKQIKSVSGTEAVTEETDVNKMLNKNGGYTACVYFTSKNVNQKLLYGDTIAEKGTDAGGAIEVFSSTKDAEKREKYLATFDGSGALDSGSHVVLGTVLIRTSNELTATQQKKLTNQISDKLTELQ